MKNTFKTIACLSVPLYLFGSGCVTKSVYLKEVQRGDKLKVDSEALAAQIQYQQSQLDMLQLKLKDLQTNYDALLSTNEHLLKDLDAKKGELNQRVADLTKENQGLSQQLRDTEQAKEAEIARLKGSYDELVNGLKNELQAGQVTITQLKGRLSVNMVDKILFNSGEAEVKPEGRHVLERVGEVLKKLADKDIRIEGYTDDVPISSALRSKYPTNWELSTARATSVVRYLQDKVGIQPDRLIAVGYGETHPIAENTTSEGRQQNRRIEIVLGRHEITDSPSSPVSVSTSTPAAKSPN